MPLKLNKPIHFGTFLVTPQVFHVTPLSFALVNLKPLLPGHVLVCPIRVVPRVSDLSHSEITDLFATVQKVACMVERVYKASALNIAIQDGASAGQSVPHVHAHIIPRKDADLDSKGGGDAIYGMLEGDDGNLGKQLREQEQKSFAATDAERKPRGMEDMHKEAEWLADEMAEEAHS